MRPPREPYFIQRETLPAAIRPLLPPGEAHLIPVEILSEIFLLVLQYGSSYKTNLVLVCQRWYAIMLSIPSITSRLRIGRSTKKEIVQAFIQERKTRLLVIVDMNDERDGKDFNADDFHASFMAAVQVASKWRSLVLSTFPPPGEHKEAYTIVQPLESLWTFSMSNNCDLGSSFEPLITAIATTAPPHLTEMNLSNLKAVLYLVQPAYLPVFRTLTTLKIRLSKRMETPVDILPHLQRLKHFDAWHLHLPIYSPDASLPLIQTLHHLTLKSMSVQWMAGKVFPVLKICSITFPHHIDTIRLRPVTMPACTRLEYDSNDLDPLRYFHALPLDALDVTSGQWNARRGNLQLVAICPIVVASAQRLKTLDLQVQCSEQLLGLLLGLVPALDTLVLRLASPCVLSEAFFRAFVAANYNANGPHELVTLARRPLCTKLRGLRVEYKRWLRRSERKTLIPVFSDIVSSRWMERYFYLHLNFDGFDPKNWRVGKPVGRIQGALDYAGMVIGVSSPHGIIPLRAWGVHTPQMEVPFKEAEYLVAHYRLSIECLFDLRHLVELKVRGEKDIYMLPSEPPPNLPLFRTLRVLEAQSIHPSFLASRTFHKLERCRISLYGEGPNPSQGQVTQMPVCKRVDVEDLVLLATLKLPQICELSTSFAHPEFNMIWEKCIAVNANLSGLELLHVYGWNQQADLVQALRYLPVLKTLILENGSHLDANFFGVFLPMDSHGTSVSTQPGDEAPISAILCPMLGELLIEQFDLSDLLRLIPILKKVVTLRAVAGFPLKTFTFTDFGRKKEFKLIGNNGSFVLKRVILGEFDGPFRLDI